MTARRRRPATATGLAAGLVGALSLVPVAYLFLSGISFGDIQEQFRFPGTAAALWQTVGLTALISALTIVLGVGCALLVVRTALPYPRLFTVLFVLPLAVPGFVAAYAAYSAELTFLPNLGLVTSFGGAAIVMALSLYPYVFLPCVVALRSVDPALEEVVASLRPGRAARLWRVIVPALRPAMGVGVLIVAIHVLAEYGAMVQLNRSTLTTKIMAEMLDYGDYRSARSLSLVLIVVSLAVLGVTYVIAGRGRAGDIARGTARPPARHPLGALRVPATALALTIPLLAIGPAVFMTVRGLTNSGRGAPVEWHEVGAALGTTLGYAVAAALVATLVALPVSWCVVRRPSVASTVAERAVWVAHAIPSAILAFALVYLAVRLVPSLYKTSTVLIAGYVILFLPLAVANQRVGLDASRRTYDDVAASLGARPARAFFRISMPLAVPGFLAGALLVALDASKELTATLMLIPYNAHTLSTELWATTNGESLDFTAAAPYAAMLVLLGAGPVYLLARHVLRHVDAVPAASRPAGRRITAQGVEAAAS